MFLNCPELHKITGQNGPSMAPGGPIRKQGPPKLYYQASSPSTITDAQTGLTFSSYAHLTDQESLEIELIIVIKLFNSVMKLISMLLPDSPSTSILSKTEAEISLIGAD